MGHDPSGSLAQRPERTPAQPRLGAVGLGSNAGPHFCFGGLCAFLSRPTDGELEEHGMSADEGLVLALEAANRASPFHRITGFTIEHASPGEVRLLFEAKPELLNHAGALHAGVQCAALDTVAGYAAATMAGPVVTLQLTTSFLSSAKGETFVAEGKVVKAGKKQLFVEARLCSLASEGKLVATASAVLAGIG
jgi:uncharacterized protein (TIGR00369 family)